MKQKQTAEHTEKKEMINKYEDPLFLEKLNTIELHFLLVISKKPQIISRNLKEKQS